VKVIGFSSGGTGHEGNVDRMVKAILARTDGESEFVKLTDLDFTGCKGCVRLCAKPLMCQIRDDLYSYYQKLLEADAVVLGTPVHFGSISAIISSFIERFFGYRHVDVAIEDKPFVLVVSGSRLDGAEEHFLRALRPFRTRIVDLVRFRSRNFPCLWCQRHDECSVGGLYRDIGSAAYQLKITPDLFHRWEDHPETVEALDAAVEKLRGVLAEASSV